VPCTKFASATVYDVPSVTAHDDDNTQRTLPPPLLRLGSVSYSDTFIDSAITARHTGLLAHLSVTPVCHTCLTHLSDSPVCHTCLSHLSVTPVCHTCLTHLSVSAVCLTSYSDTFIDSVITACHTGQLAHLSVSPVCLTCLFLTCLSPLFVSYLICHSTHTLTLQLLTIWECAV